MHTRGCAAYSFKHEKFQIAMFANNIENDQGNLFLQVCRSLAELFPNGRKDVAKKLGISDPHFNKWKNGKLEGEKQVVFTGRMWARVCWYKDKLDRERRCAVRAVQVAASAGDPTAAPAPARAPGSGATPVRGLGTPPVRGRGTPAAQMLARMLQLEKQLAELKKQNLELGRTNAELQTTNAGWLGITVKLVQVNSLLQLCVDTKQPPQ